MAANNVDFNVGLKDNVSRGAKTAGASLSSLLSTAKGVEGGLKTLALGVKGLVASMAVGFIANSVRDLARLHSQTRLNTQAFARFGKEGTDALTRIQDFSTQSGLGFEKGTEVARKFLNVFGNTTDAENLVKILRDTQYAAGLGVESTDALADSFAELAAEANVGTGDFKKWVKLVETSEEDLADAIAKSTGASLKETKKLIGAGKLLPEQLISGINRLNKMRLDSNAMGIGGLASAVKDPIAQMQKLEDAWTKTKLKIAGAVFTDENIERFSAVVDDITKKTNDPEFIKGLQAFATIAKGVLVTLEASVAAVGKIVKYFENLKKEQETAAKKSAEATERARRGQSVGNDWGIKLGVDPDQGGRLPGNALPIDPALPGNAMATPGERQARDIMRDLASNTPKGWMRGLDGNLRKAGEALPEGLAKGIKSATPAAEKSIWDMATATEDSLADHNETHSPSRLYERYGRWAVKGYMQGILAEQKTQEFVNAMKFATTPPRANAPVSTTPGGGPAGGGKTIQVNGGINVTVNLPAGADAKTLGEQGSREILLSLEDKLLRGQLSAG